MKASPSPISNKRIGFFCVPIATEAFVCVKEKLWNLKQAEKQLCYPWFRDWP